MLTGHSPQHSQRCQPQPGTATSKWRIEWSGLKLGNALGKGAFGVVHAATWAGASVAIKLLGSAAAYGDEDKAFEAFEKEVRIRIPRKGAFLSS